MDTPMVDTFRTLTPHGGNESDPVIDVGQGPFGDRASLRRAGSDHVVESVAVLEQFQGAVADGRHALDHGLGQVLLAVAVALSVVDRTSVVQGKSVSVRVDVCGRRSVYK